MAWKRWTLSLAFAAAVVLVAGCSDNSVNPTTQPSDDRQMITGTLGLESQFLDDGTFDTQSSTNLAAVFQGSRAPSRAAGTAGATIDPFYFWRQIAHRTLSFEFTFSDSDSTDRPTTALVTVRRDFSGTFNIVPRDPNNPNAPDPNSAHVIHKPLLDHWVRQFLLKRIVPQGGSQPVWKLAAVTAIQVTSENATSAITSVRLQSASFDSTLTDPSVLIPLRRVLRFTTEDTITVTVTTPRTDDVVLLYHHDHRVRLTNNGDGTYSGKFRAGVFTGWRHFGVNALSHGTLYDDAAPYDSKAWIYPYVIVGGPLVDYLP